MEKECLERAAGFGCESLIENLRFYELELSQLEATRPWGPKIAKILKFAKNSWKLTSEEQGLSYANVPKGTVADICIYIYMYMYIYIYIKIYIAFRAGPVQSTLVPFHSISSIRNRVRGIR